MDKFIRVRSHVARLLDLSLFQFDPDLTFAVFFLNADRTIYGRYGSRSDFIEAERDISLQGLAKAMQGALDVHAGYPANRSSLAGKSGSKPPFATLMESGFVKRQPRSIGHCGHCHHLQTARQDALRRAGRPFPDDVVYPWPMPETIGLVLDSREKATVRRVAKDSAAQRAGFRSGDMISHLDGQPVLSIADVQWVLHSAKGPSTIEVEITREAKRVSLSLRLDEGWRQRSDISWRVTTGNLRRYALGRMRLEELGAEDRRRVGLGDDEMALRVKNLRSESPAGRAGFRRGDVIVEFDGQSKRASESQLLAIGVQNHKHGDRIDVTVLRDGARKTLTLPLE